MKSKLLILSTSILLITNISFAQTDQLSQKIINEICPCLETAVKNKSTEEAQKIFERCSKASFEKYDKEIEAASIEPSASALAEGFVHLIGKRLHQV